MIDVVSNYKITISGINLKNDFQISKSICEEYVSDIICTKLENNAVEIKCKITSKDKNTNYLVSEKVHEFMLNLFSMFGTCVRVREANLDTSSDFLPCEAELCPPLSEVEGNEINAQLENVIKSFSNPQMNGVFHNLVESNQQIGMIHRFRALFSVFDTISPKNSYKTIDYKEISETFRDEITKKYGKFTLARYLDIINEFQNAKLKDDRTNINYSKRLELEMKKLKHGEFINKDVAFNIMKCIQILRNKLNHGNFINITPKLISGGYELLLVITQKLIRV